MGTGARWRRPPLASGLHGKHWQPTKDGHGGSYDVLDLAKRHLDICICQLEVWVQKYSVGVHLLSQHIAFISSSVMGVLERQRPERTGNLADGRRRGI